MPRFAVRRAATDPAPSATGPVLWGLGLGALLGFLIGELAGPLAERTITRRGRPVLAPHRVSELVGRAQAVLDDEQLA